MKTTTYLLAVIAILLNALKTTLYIRINLGKLLVFAVDLLIWVLISLALVWILKRIFTWRHWYIGKERRAAWMYAQILYVLVAGGMFAWSFYIGVTEHRDTYELLGNVYTTSELTEPVADATTSQKVSLEDRSDVLAIEQSADVLSATIHIEIDDGDMSAFAATGVYLGNGVILTNYHLIDRVISEPRRYEMHGCITVALDTQPDCRLSLSLTPRVGEQVENSQYDEKNDLALLYLDDVFVGDRWLPWRDASAEDTGLRAVALSSYLENYSDIKVGDVVYTIGYPDYATGNTTLTKGTVRGFVARASEDGAEFVTDMRVSSGSSGGPVFNTEGKLVGIVSACVINNADSCDSGIVIPLPTIASWYAGITGQGRDM